MVVSETVSESSVGTALGAGKVAELTRALPSLIRFSVSDTAPRPPLSAARRPDGTFMAQTLDLQGDMYALLGWAREHAVELRGLEAGPTRLDDVFRALDTADA